jgi:hypothetical protein
LVICATLFFQIEEIPVSFEVGYIAQLQLSRYNDGSTARVRFPAWQDFSLLHSVHTEFEAHPSSYPIGTGSNFPGDKATGA